MFYLMRMTQGSDESGIVAMPEHEAKEIFVGAKLMQLQRGEVVVVGSYAYMDVAGPAKKAMLDQIYSGGWR